MLYERRHDGPTSTVWLWPGADGRPEGPPSAWPPAAATLLIAWKQEPGVAWVHGFLGRVTRGNLRELLALLERHGAQRVKAYRRDGRSLPGAVVVDDHFEIDVPALKARVG